MPEIEVLMHSGFNPSSVQIVVLSTLLLEESQIDWWLTWWDEGRKLAGDNGIVLQALDFRVLDDNYSAAAYHRLTHLPLINISPD